MAIEKYELNGSYFFYKDKQPVAVWARMWASYRYDPDGSYLILCQPAELVRDFLVNSYN